MKRIVNQLVWAACLTLTLGTTHQLHGQNAMDFDGIDDQMTVPNASALIANSNLSLSLWVYPTNGAAGWPDFDGIAGFRNDVDADFYLTQLSSTQVEARFRGSGGTAYDILFTGLQLNAWNHIVLTYDGSTLSLYHNGNLFGSTSASGTITNTTSTFRMGMLPYSLNEFYLDGQLEDVGLWSKSLSANEVSTLYNACSVDLNDVNLELCYEFNQGIGGGNNTAISSATDSKGNIDATMSGFTLTGNSSNFIPHDNAVTNTISETQTCTYTSPSGNYVWTSTGQYNDTLQSASGCDSILTIDLTILPVTGATLTETACHQYTSPSGNYVWTSSGQHYDTLQSSTGCDSLLTINLTIIPATASTITETACDQYTSPSGNYVWTSSGQYYDTVPSAAGCDSVITIDLTINTVDVSVTDNAPTLIANASGATYLWLDCDNNYSAISGETNQAFTATSNGNYAVQVTESGCSDTSSCIMINNVGIGERTNQPAELIRVTDILGRETTPVANRPLIYYYSDGTIRRMMKLEQ